MQTLLIIFGISLFGILVMIYRGFSRARRIGLGHENGPHPLVRHIAYVWKKISIIFSYIAHSFAIFISKIWARISHRVLIIRRSIVNRIENYFKHTNEKNINKDAKTQSILLTTIKAYKKEIKKLKQTIEPDEIRPKDNTKVE